MDKICWICASGNQVDNHHIDCLRGHLSPKTLPLCRRCHQTYHIWGVSTFSPDTTEKAVELENERREILLSLPTDHPQRIRSYRMGELSPLKLEEIRRSHYWYRKWGIKPPPREKGEIRLTDRLSFRLPMSPPICGEEWLNQHMRDFTTEDIEALSIEIAYGEKKANFSLADKRGMVKKTLAALRR